MDGATEEERMNTCIEDDLKPRGLLIPEKGVLQRGDNNREELWSRKEKRCKSGRVGRGVRAVGHNDGQDPEVWALKT